MQPLNDNPRLGFESKNPALHPGHNVCQSTVALRLSWSVASKARQSEVMGRFLSPDWAADPTAVPYASYANPQSLNLYNYMRNPLSGADPDGHLEQRYAMGGDGWGADNGMAAGVGYGRSMYNLLGSYLAQQQSSGDDSKPHTTETVTVTAKPSIWKRIGSWFGSTTHAVSYGMTAFMITHSHSAMEGNKSSFEYWSKQSNEDIIKSLNPGGKEPMQIRMEGENARVLNGNMRYSILQSRGADLGGLKPEVLPPVTLEPMIEPTIEPEIIP
jgi:hypothetical protein